MKNLIYILSVMIISTLTYAETVDESKIDIYFGNGVWNKQFSTDGCKKDSAADCSKEILNLLIQKEIIAKGDPGEVKRYSDVKLQYNWGKGHLNDVLETYYQLREAKQINNLEFFLLMSKLTYGVPIVSQIVTAALMASLPAIAEIEQDNVDEMLKKYYNESFKWSHRVLLISHSQGNMFANRIYDSLKISDYYKGYEKYFTNVQVGSPASSISTPEGKYITNRGDLVINPIPGSMTANANPDPENRVSSECLSALLSFESIGIYNNCLNEQDNHKFVPFYLGQSDPLSQIIPAIRYQLDALNQRETQWKTKEEGCTCEEKHVTVTHEFDDEADILMEDKKVKDFSSVSGGEGKIYSVGEQYVKASFGGTKIEEVEESETCFILKDESDIRLGEIRGINVTPVTTHTGALKMTLSWTYQCDIDMDLTMKGNDAVVYDIKDIDGAGKEHLYIPSLFDINPGDHYIFNADGKQLPESTLTEETLAEDPIEIRALLETAKGDYFNVWPVESFNSLNLGEFAEVYVYETIQAEWVCPAVNDVPDWYRPYNADTESFQCLHCPSPYSIAWRAPAYAYQKGSWYCNRPKVYSSSGGGGGRTYNACSEEEKKSTCGCVPCDYIVSGMKKRIENGPIAGAKVEIIKASDADGINPNVLYRGGTTDKEDIFQSGMLEIPDETLDTFEDDEYYLVLAEGGRDIDRNDDMVRDSVPTQNNGTIHALIKGSDLKRLPFRVNILTEAIYQVSGNSIGLNYDASALQTKLNTTAQKLINHKLYPGDDDNRINYKDVLLWTPAVDKKALYKPFTTYVEPIIKNLYENKERFDESYRLIYELYNSDAPQLEPLALEIPVGLDNGTVIAQIKTQNHKSFAHILLTGNFSEHFSIDDEGYIHIDQSASIEESNRYRLQIKAVDTAGREGSFVSLLIEVKGQIVQADPTRSKPRFVSVETFDTPENAPEGTVVANTYFEDSNQTIVSYTLSGEDNTSFSVDEQGIVTVSANANIDYEKSKIYHFAISAINDVGNESYPITISVPIVNQLDTPLFDLVVFEHIEENIPKGSVITTIRVDREGLGDIDKFEILSPNMPFKIDNNGTLIVSNYIDYEQVKQYDFYAIARTKYGNSNKIEIHIVVDDQSPEIGVPTLEDLTIIVDEDVSAGSKIAQLTLDTGATAIERIALYGEDDNFRVDNNGSVYLADHARLDYETKIRYDLGARALNSRGYGNEVHIVINVNNIADELPTLGAFRGAVDENASAGTLVGNIQIGVSAEVAIESIILNGEGSEDFVIDSNGSIRVSNLAHLDYENKKSYVLKAVASSSTGFISEGEVIVSLYNVPEFVPVLKTLNVSVEEHAEIGTVVGTIEVENAGDTAILSFDLNETTVFSVDKNGTIRLLSDLDWSNRTQYLLEITANNSAGASIAVSANITILRNNYSSGDLDDHFTGSSRDETFDTKDGNDVVYAQAGNDIVIGGKGNDILYGGHGDDVYKYALGDGNDTIEDVYGNDQLVLHNIEKNRLSFSLSESSLIIHIEEDNSTIVIQNWKNDSYKIENIIFDDTTEISLEDFNLPIVKPDAGIVDLSKLGNLNAQQVVEGRIVPISSGYNSVDHWIFNYGGGTLEIDLLSELASNGQTYIDIDRDGKQTGVDVYIYLFKKDQNANWQVVAGNDDSGSGRADGSSHNFDSYLNLNLAEGEYMLAVSNFYLESSTALGDRNAAGGYPNGGPYQISFNETLEFSQFPENANNNLYGIDHYNFYVLRNDIDPYNIDGLRIVNLSIVDENGTGSDVLGTVQTEGMYISYYPETYFENLDESVEVNVLYDVLNQNGISAKSMLTLQVIPSLYTHIEPIVNQVLWDDIKSENSISELNITTE